MIQTIKRDPLAALPANLLQDPSKRARLGLDIGNGSVKAYAAYIDNDGRVRFASVQIGDSPAVESRMIVRNKNKEMKVLIGEEATDLDMTGESVSFSIGKDGLQQCAIDGKSNSANDVYAFAEDADEGRSSMDSPGQEFSAQEWIKLFLSELRSRYEKILGKANCKISVFLSFPANFSTRERRLLVDAVGKAEFNVTGYAEEPIQAFRSFIDDIDLPDEVLVVVLDYGGGTTDFAVLYINKRKREAKVLSTSACSVAGNNLTDTLLQLALQKARPLWKTENGKEPEDPEDYYDLVTLRREILMAKHELSTSEATTVSVSKGPQLVCVDITRGEFEEACQSHVDIINNSLDQVLRDANISDTEIPAVILTGGPSQTPFIQRSVETRFADAQIFASDRPEFDVVLGNAQCAIAGCIAENRLPVPADFLPPVQVFTKLQDNVCIAVINPASNDINDQINKLLIPQGAQLPVSQEIRDLFSHFAGASNVLIQITNAAPGENFNKKQVIEERILPLKVIAGHHNNIGLILEADKGGIIRIRAEDRDGEESIEFDARFAIHEA